MCSFAKNPAHIHVSKGGTDVHHSPTINYLKHVLLRILRGMALETSLQVHKYGYYPKGMGEVSVSIQPNPKLSPLCCEEREHISLIEGVSVCTFLADRKVAWRQAKAAEQFLEKHGYKTNIKIVNDRSNPLQKGSSLTLWASSDSVFLGGDAIGELRKTSENVGKEAAENLIAELDAEATVDSHLADMIIPYIALSDADSVFLTRKISDHLETNIWLAQRILDTEFKISRIGNLYRVEKKTS
jgi:RNA 3'-terminal phosphate cyclase (ATP)